MKKQINIPVLFTDKDIYVRESVISGLFYLEQDGEIKGSFRKSSNTWTLIIGCITKRYGTLTDLFKDATKMLS